MPLRSRKGIQEAVLLFDYMAKKQKVSFAPVFQPLLGPLDAAAERLLLERLQPALPEEKEEQIVFFNPNLTAAKKKHQQFLENQVSLLRRFLVNRGPIMPVGLLRFCLEYARKDEAAPPGILAVVRERFPDLGESQLPELLGATYDFRNTYIAHEKDELTDRKQAKEGLERWIEALIAVHEAATREPLAGKF